MHDDVEPTVRNKPFDDSGELAWAGIGLVVSMFRASAHDLCPCAFGCRCIVAITMLVSRDDKLAACDALAYYLSGEEVQLERYKEAGWGPSNLKAQESSDVKSDVALSALAEQLKYSIPQGQYPADYWTLATSLGDSIRNGELTSDSSDDDLMAVLSQFQDTCESYVQ